jgi:hypothetical protein
MAPDSGSPTQFGHGFQEFDLEGETSSRLEVGGSAEIDSGLSTMKSCVDALLQARDAGTIRFAEGVTGRMFEVMGVLLMRAAHVSERSRQAMFQHWKMHGTDMVAGLIADVAARQGKMLMPEDLATAFMGTPPGH